jgi:uncharacterized protein
MKYMAKCPECDEKIRAGKEWSLTDSNYRTCPRCETRLRRVNTDTQPLTSIIAIVVLTPLVISIATCAGLFNYIGPWALLIVPVGVVLMFVVNAIQYPYTNTFERYDDSDEQVMHEFIQDAQKKMDQRRIGGGVEPVMPTEDLPVFKYHPDPVKTGCVAGADTVCVSCGVARGYVYIGPVFAQEEYDECICPWCIADGTAHEKLGAEFTDAAGVGGGGRWEMVTDDVVDEVARRTPGFCGWQQEQWATHCGDACMFLGRVGYWELKALGPEAIEAIRLETSLEEGPEWDRFYQSLDKDGSPTAYLFMCIHCQAYVGYTDCD